MTVDLDGAVDDVESERIVNSRKRQQCFADVGEGALVPNTLQHFLDHRQTGNDLPSAAQIIE